MTSDARSADVIIVGGGVIGTAVAFFLGADHHARVIIVERDGVATNASGTAAGELSPAGRSQLDPAMAGADPFAEFCAEGLRLHRSMAPALLEESGIDYDLADTTVLRPAFDEAEAEALQPQVDLQRGIGMPAEWLDAVAVAAIDSWLPAGVLGAIHTKEAQVETAPFARALAGAAESNGASIVRGEVTGLLREGDRATGVIAGAASYAGQAVVVAAGPWSQMAGPWMGMEVPVIPLRGQIVHLKGPPVMPRHAIFHGSGYVLPKPNGTIYAGTTEEEAGFSAETTDEATASILEATRRLAPRTDGLAIERVTACLRPISGDGLPIIGAVPGWRALYLATGHGRKGILPCLVTGRYLAQLIARGKSDYPLDPFSPARLGASSTP